MKIYAIRHLPTPYNQRGIFQGYIDNPILPLTPITAAAMQRNLAELQGIRFDAVLTSELIRTQQTAQRYDFDAFEVEPLLNELHLGKLSGQNRKAFIEEHKEAWYNHLDQLPLGETLDNFKARIEQFIEKYQHMDKVLVFSHGAMLRGIHAVIHGIPLNRMNTTEIRHNELVVFDATLLKKKL